MTKKEKHEHSPPTNDPNDYLEQPQGGEDSSPLEGLEAMPFESQTSNKVDT